MRQELVFIGQGLDKAQIIHQLENCLISEAQLLEGKEAWAKLADPFPLGS